jgi:uncharacterized membrane protein YeaQ/YmgE (transglycosylase-associated protein family)
MMLMVSWIVIGLVAGALTGSLMKKLRYGGRWGLWLDMFIGAAGAALGGMMIRSSAFIDEGWNINSIVIALALAAAVTALNGWVGGRRRHA